MLYATAIYEQESTYIRMGADGEDAVVVHAVDPIFGSLAALNHVSDELVQVDPA